MGVHGMKHLVRFWDSPLSRRVVAIDFLTADSFADAMEKAAAHAELLRSEFDGRLGYSIQRERAAHFQCTMWYPEIRHDIDLSVTCQARRSPGRTSKVRPASSSIHSMTIALQNNSF
jgi:hypothetical protein